MRQLPEPQDPAAIRMLAEHLLRGQLVHDGMVAPSDLLVVFLPVAFMDFTGLPEEDVKELAVIGILGVHATAPMGINGHPCFLEVVLLRRSCLRRAARTAKAMNDAMQAVPVDDAG